MKPDIVKATRLPRGIERPQRAVTAVRSESGNQALQNWVIMLKYSGHAIDSQISPIMTGRNVVLTTQSSLNQPPVSIMTQEMRVMLCGDRYLYSHIERNVVGI